MIERNTVVGFVAHLRTIGYPILCVEERPDELNRDSPDIDAIAGTFAIEHTSIDTLPNQRRASDWFLQVVDDLEEKLNDELLYRLRVTIDFDGVGKGQNWPNIREALKRWATKDASCLPERRSVVEDFPGIPFPLHVMKSSRRPHGIRFARFEPVNSTPSARIKGLFDGKAAKLADYKPRGFTTLLLVESDDIALMNEHRMITVIQEAFPTGPPPGIDQVWFVDTSTAVDPTYKRVDWEG